MPRFPVVLRGYDCAQVDALTARIEDALRHGVGFLTADDVLRSRFAVVLRGYDQSAVDDYLYACVRELQARGRTRTVPQPARRPERPKVTEPPQRPERSQQPGPARPAEPLSRLERLRSRRRRDGGEERKAELAPPAERPQERPPAPHPRVPRRLEKLHGQGRRAETARPAARVAPAEPAVRPDPPRRPRRSPERLVGWIQRVRFSGAQAYPGYDSRQVDAFLGRVVAGLRGTAPPVTAAETRAVVFGTVEPGYGYNQYEVDRFLADLAEALESVPAS